MARGGAARGVIFNFQFLIQLIWPPVPHSPSYFAIYTPRVTLPLCIIFFQKKFGMSFTAFLMASLETETGINIV